MLAIGSCFGHRSRITNKKKEEEDDEDEEGGREGGREGCIETDRGERVDERLKLNVHDAQKTSIGDLVDAIQNKDEQLASARVTIQAYNDERHERDADAQNKYVSPSEERAMHCIRHCPLFSNISCHNFQNHMHVQRSDYYIFIYFLYLIAEIFVVWKNHTRERSKYCAKNWIKQLKESKN